MAKTKSSISAEAIKVHPRPLSPHISRYAWSLTMATSICHRITGVFLTAGLIMISWWILAVTSLQEDQFAQFYDFLHTPIGRFLVLGWRFSIAFHICNGIRHLIWDIGYGFKPSSARNGSIIVIIATFVLTAVLYWVTFMRWFQLV